jgi:hypothetical protein
VLNGQVCAKARAHSFTTGTDPLEEPAFIFQGKAWAPAEPCHALPLYGRGPRVHEPTRALGLAVSSVSKPVQSSGQRCSSIRRDGCEAGDESMQALVPLGPFAVPTCSTA